MPNLFKRPMNQMRQEGVQGLQQTQRAVRRPGAPPPVMPAARPPSGPAPRQPMPQAPQPGPQPLGGPTPQPMNRPVQQLPQAQPAGTQAAPTLAQPPQQSRPPQKGGGGAAEWWDKINKGGDGRSAAAQPFPTSDNIDQSIRLLVDDLVNGKANTADEEALIRQQFEDKQGQALVDARASMGRGGFASSGAMGAQEGDIRRQASQAALDEILGVRRDAEKTRVDNAMAAIDAERAMRESGRDDAINQALIAALGGPSDVDENGNPIGSTLKQPDSKLVGFNNDYEAQRATPQDVLSGQKGSLESMLLQPVLPSSPRIQQEVNRTTGFNEIVSGDEKLVAAPPAGSVQIGDTGDVTVWMTHDGQIVYVKKG